MNLFNGVLSFTSITNVSPGVWNITADFLDYTGYFTALDIQLLDRVFNDGLSLNEDVKVYKVIDVDPSTTFSSFVGTIEWDRPRDIDTPLEPYTGFETSISRVVNDQAFVASAPTQLFSFAFIDGIRNEEMLRVASAINNSIQQSIETVKINSDTGNIIKCMVVSDVNVAGVVRATNTTRDGATAIGFCDTASAAPGSNLIVQLNGLLTATTTQWDAVTGGSGGLIEGDIYYVGSTPGMITNQVPSSGFIAKVGNAIDSTTLKINIEAPIGL